MPESYDVIIIGGGPAGLTAGLYTSRARLPTLLLERGLMGGQIVNAERVENYPGFPEGISGMELGERLHLQATKYGLQTLSAEARGIELRASRILQERAFAQPRLDFLWNSVVEEVQGEDQVKGLRLRGVKTGERSFLEVGGVFVAIGLVPNTRYLEGALKLDDAGQIETNERLEASLRGVFAAGDIRHSSARQAIAAAGDRASAALSAERFLQEQG